MSGHYYVPESSRWPVFAVLVIALFAVGAAASLSFGSGAPLMFAGLAGILLVMFFWFRDVARESMAGLYDQQMDRSFRQGMAWFIFSEIMFFSAFFGALFYIRMFALPWLDGEGAKGISALLWPEFVASWPLLNPPGDNINGPVAVIDPWHLPLINTLLLVSSSVTLTLSHHALKKNKLSASQGWLAVTLLLGFSFLVIQGVEYVEAYQKLGLTLQAGVYGGTFFLLTGFHGLHVTIGALTLLVIFIRLLRRHFSAAQHFGFEAAAWYWHFVDVVWLGLFIFVYVV
ncbi:cytochrome c oxidase subunit 3 [Bacterioplanoides pacificum]|uniref:cytochrome-c oxidase n=1 Tax=Bacterioplanoides pacificum TaxID=1171596 RepID=A0ABV7VQQ8_9GAMM